MIGRGKFKGKFFFLTPATILVPRTELYFNCKRAEDELGYKPMISFNEGLLLTFEFCRRFNSNTNSKGQ